jgi:hypothetical protein
MPPPVCAARRTAVAVSHRRDAPAACTMLGIMCVAPDRLLLLPRRCTRKGAARCNRRAVLPLF